MCARKRTCVMSERAATGLSMATSTTPVSGDSSVDIPSKDSKKQGKIGCEREFEIDYM